MNVMPNILIVSVFQYDVSYVSNFETHTKMLKALQGKGVPCVELKGKYEDQEEMSILIEGFEHRKMVEEIQRDFNQASYLESHNDRETFLIYANGEREYIGKLVNVTKEEAERYKAYSYAPGTGQYFIAV